MGKTYRPYRPDEEFLLPPSPRDWLPEGHLAYFVSDVVDSLDLSAIEAVYSSERGQPPYNPHMMTKVLVYGYCMGVFSSRRMERKLVEDIAFRVLAAGNRPNFRTISDFRKIHLKALAALFEQVLQIALEAGAIKVGRVALDGTKVKANASKHKAMSYDRMLEKEKQLKAEVEQLLEQAEAMDAEEDRRHGKNRRGDELPDELARRESRLKRIEEAKRALAERAKERAKAGGSNPDMATPKEKDQYNFTDPESRMMKGADGFVQAYNAQAAVEAEFQLIVGQGVTQATNDKEQLAPLLEAVEEQSGQRPEVILADSGYCSEKNLAALESVAAESKIIAYVATQRQRHGEYKEPCPRGPLPKDATRVERMRRKLKTKVGKAAYAARKTIVEPVFGQIKQARGFRQFLLRGIEKVRAEWAMVCLTHNILKLYRLCYE